MFSRSPAAACGPHAHTLKYVASSAPSRRTCDYCRGGGTGPWWECRPCNFDLCSACFWASRSKPTMPTEYAHSHALERDIRSGPNVCNLCHETKSQLVTCRACNYDECYDCYRRSGSSLAGDSGGGGRGDTLGDALLRALITGAVTGSGGGGGGTDHAHPLVYTRSATTRCDGCRATGTGIFWQCRPCHFDLCTACYRRSRNRTTLPTEYEHPHPLSSGVRAGAVRCNLCGTTTSDLHTCRECDWDECGSCFRQSNSKPSAAAIASLLSGLLSSTGSSGGGDPTPPQPARSPAPAPAPAPAPSSAASLARIAELEREVASVRQRMEQEATTHRERVRDLERQLDAMRGERDTARREAAAAAAAGPPGGRLATLERELGAARSDVEFLRRELERYTAGGGGGGGGGHGGGGGGGYGGGGGGRGGGGGGGPPTQEDPSAGPTITFAYNAAEALW